MSQFVAAFCRTCGGWTMFHGDPTSGTASKWARRCVKAGDEIKYLDAGTELGVGCSCPLPRTAAPRSA